MSLLSLMSLEVRVPTKVQGMAGSPTSHPTENSFRGGGSLYKGAVRPSTVVAERSVPGM